ncbi:MAG: hypothetical protein AB1571_00925 [Nanoarchaeota archaeon]
MTSSGIEAGWGNKNDEAVQCKADSDCNAGYKCVNNEQARSCNDLNNCNVLTGRPALVQNCNAQCTPNWKCSSWSQCTNNQQSRTCTIV